jgi:hypothetical protein
MEVRGAAKRKPSGAEDFKHEVLTKKYRKVRKNIPVRLLSERVAEMRWQQCQKNRD